MVIECICILGFITIKHITISASVLKVLTVLGMSATYKRSDKKRIKGFGG